MSDHLSSSILNSLVDGELPADDLARVNEHLAACSACTSQALAHSLLKSATGRAGRRYIAPSHLEKQLSHLGSKAPSNSAASALRVRASSELRSSFSRLGWLAAAAILLVAVSLGIVQSRLFRSERSALQRAGLIAEVSDQHVATLAAGLPPQVISTDRHTVKPWFQGKLPFSFNLPDNLPAGTTLDGANLTYLGSQPVAQLLYSIGKHHVSVFMREATIASLDKEPLRADRAGFHIAGFHTADLQVIAVSDADPVRLQELVTAIERAQSRVRVQ